MRVEIWHPVLIEGTHVTHVSIALCPISKCCPQIIMHGPKLRLECTAGSLVCSLGSLIIRFCKKTIMSGAFVFKQLLDIHISYLEHKTNGLVQRNINFLVGP